MARASRREGHRDKILLATKCGRYDVAQFDFSAARVRLNIQASLRRLRIDYLDVFLANDIEFVGARQIIEEAIPAMRALQREGKARWITGLQLNMPRKVGGGSGGRDSLLLGYNLLIADMDDLLTPFAKGHGIGLINASPPWHPASPEVKAMGRKVVQFCAERGVRSSDVALQFCLQHPYVATTLAGMSTVEQVRQNIAAANAPADDGLIAEIRQLIAPVKNRSWPSGRPENQDHAS